MSKYKEEKCPNCGASEIGQDLKCNYCGSKLSRTDEKLVLVTVGFRCIKCHNDNKEENDFCQKCGEKLKKKCPFCLTMHAITAQFCPKSGYDIKEYEEKLRKMEENKVNKQGEKKKKVDVKNILKKTIDKEKRDSYSS